MAIAKCPECGESLRIGDDAVGQSIDCPICGKVFRTKLPQVKAAPPATAAPQAKAYPIDDQLTKPPPPVGRGPRHIAPSPFDFTAKPPEPDLFADEPTPARSAPIETPALRDGIYCFGCGAWIHRGAEACPKCGVRQFEPGRAEPKKDAVVPVTSMLITILAGVVFLIGFVLSASPWTARSGDCLAIGAAVWMFASGLVSTVIGFGHRSGTGVACGVIGILALVVSGCLGIAFLAFVVQSPRF